MKTSLPEFTTTNAYGRAVHMSPCIKNDAELFERIGVQTDLYMDKFCKGTYLDHKCDGKFMDIMDATLRSLGGEGDQCHLFSEIKDHMNHPIRRYILKIGKVSYIIDLFLKLNVRLDINPFKRFLYLHVPSMIANIDGSDFVPRIEYCVRVWNSPIGYYQYTLAKADIPTEYSSQIEKYRDLVGYPEMYTLEEKKIYERADYDVRRAIFGEVFDI